MSTIREPLTVPSSKPASPATTSSTSGGPGSMVMIMSLFSTTSLGESATDAPRHELFRLISGAIVDHVFMARLQEIARYGRAHDPEPHEPHLLHHRSPFFDKTYVFGKVGPYCQTPARSARPIPADAVIGVDVDYESIQVGQGGCMLMVSASETAVKM